MPALSRPSNTVKPLADTVLVSVPPSLTAPGKPGYWARNSTHYYCYTGDGRTHTWRRIAWTAEA